MSVGIPSLYSLPKSHPRVVRFTHWVNTVCFFALLVSGIAILLAHPRLYLGETGNVNTPSLIDLPLPFLLTGQSGWGRSLHFLAAWICLINGSIYVARGRPCRNCEPLQKIAYRLVLFVLLPIAIWTGFAMSPALTSAMPGLVTILGGQQSARTIHFFVAGALVLFLFAHVVMVIRARAVASMIFSRGADRPISRRSLIAGASGLGIATVFVKRNSLIPPDPGGIYGIGETLTYASQRILTARHPMAREFDRRMITRTAIPVNGDPPRGERYEPLLTNGFADWRLEVDGLVASPLSLSLADLRSFPATSQITQQACEEGWSFIAEWTGVPLALILNMAGVKPGAKYVVFFPYDTNWDSLDLSEALHPQTLLAYAMNGTPLPPEHGAPLRLRVPGQLGYKSVKYLARIAVTDTLKNIGSGHGSVSPDLGYSWYAGI